MGCHRWGHFCHRQKVPVGRGGYRCSGAPGRDGARVMECEDGGQKTIPRTRTKGVTFVMAWRERGLEDAFRRQTSKEPID